MMMQAQVQTLSSDYEIQSIKAWDEFTGAEFNVYPGGEEAFAAPGYRLHLEVTVKNNTDRWQLVYLDFTIGGMWMGTIAVYPRPHDVEVAKLSPQIDYACGYWTVKLYKDTTVYQTISFYAFKIWGGNHHLPGDVNFDGFINMEDYMLVKAQLGRTSDDVWGTGSDQYDPNRDLDMDGVISDRDAYVVRKLLGRWTEWDCLTHPNPSMINNGEGWTVTGSTVWAPPGSSVSLSTTFYENRRGFKHSFYCSAFENAGGFTEIDFTPTAHYLHNPENWKNVLPGDIPLNQLADYKFIVEGEVHDWQRYVEGYTTLEPSRTYLAWCFGGWVILSKPYEVWAVDGGGLLEFLNEQNILEPMFWIKQHRDGQTLSPGGDEFHRVVFKKHHVGELDEQMHSGWFIVGYVLGDPKVGETVRVELTGEKILQLLKTLEGKNIIKQKNPLFPGDYYALGLLIPRPRPYNRFPFTDFFLKGPLSFEGAYFRPVYIALEGGVDFTPFPTVKEVTGGSVSIYGAYLYHKKRGIVWQPTSSTVKVDIQQY
jgi:hypothetical protein